ncbi:metal-dependent hydrolase [Sutcliffiella horikoshii]|uniref:metal-dependent hydrolase n=1 Tax=Sutcliffiella horikoshii TaxID=79883 RepID=UPI00204247D5|nr:metal-dependent hydrolase [Sutcliffiella horikoshii]MCM3619958.1 metal-dependent hydrolase [Sutcliffiella horikoshii]
MHGTAHAAIGAATGFFVANSLQTTPTTTLILVSLGTVSALVPDLDIEGKLRGRITLSHTVTRTIAQIIGTMMILYSLYEGNIEEKLRGAGIGALMIIISSFIKQKHMLTITGAGVIMGGVSLQELWMILFGIYIIMASLVSHRSYTHSLIGVLFFGFIAWKLEHSLSIDGVFYTSLFAYISHLIADMKILPFNKRGIKLFLPISSKEV